MGHCNGGASVNRLFWFPGMGARNGVRHEPFVSNFQKRMNLPKKLHPHPLGGLQMFVKVN